MHGDVGITFQITITSFRLFLIVSAICQWMVFNMLMFACCLGVIDPFHLSHGSMLTTNQIWLLCFTTLPGSVLVLCAYWALIRINLHEYPQGSWQQNVWFNLLINTKLAFIVIYIYERHFACMLHHSFSCTTCNCCHLQFTASLTDTEWCSASWTAGRLSRTCQSVSGCSGSLSHCSQVCPNGCMC